LDSFNASYYGNRSFAYIKTECYGYGLADANKALELDQTYVKVGMWGIWTQKTMEGGFTVCAMDKLHFCAMLSH
jgi:hypothetical protein